MPAHVLVVEDSVTQATRLQLELQRCQVQVTVASTGKDGLATARRLLPDAIVLDIDLPELDGYAVCRALKEDSLTRHIPIVMLTSYDKANDTLKGLQLGAIDYIPKDSFANENVIASLRQLGVV